MHANSILQYYLLDYILFQGVNTPDHGVMFNTLVTSLQERVSPLVATLKSKDCSNVKNILSKTLGQILQNPQLVRRFLIKINKNFIVFMNSVVPMRTQGFKMRIGPPFPHAHQKS